MSDIPWLKEKSDAGIIARRFAHTIWKVLYGNKPGYMSLKLDSYWYEQIEKYGWRRLSKSREQEFKTRMNNESLG